MTDEDDDMRTAYAIWLQIEEAEPTEDALGVHELVRLISEPSFRLSPGQQAQLFRSPRLREDFAALKRRKLFRPMRALAAAFSGQIWHRPFQDGVVRLVLSSGESQMHLIAAFNPGSLPLGPTLLIVERSDLGLVETWPFKQPDSRREAYDLLDTNDPHTAAFLRLLRDPLAEGDFLRI